MQVKWTVTGLLYQPLELGRVVAAAIIVGGVLSTRTVCETVALFPARSLQVAVSTCTPLEVAVLPVVQLAGSIPEP